MTPKKASQSKQSYSSDHEEAPRTFANVSGQVLVTRRNPSFLSCQDIAVDPETGTALITIMEGYGERFQSYSRIVESGKIGWNVLMYDFDGMIDVEPAGERRFLALGVWSDQGSPTKTWFIYYLEYHDGMWSAPVELGKNIHVGNVAFLSDLDRRAFALWTKKDGRPVGRWIER